MKKDEKEKKSAFVVPYEAKRDLIFKHVSRDTVLTCRDFINLSC